MIILKKNAMKTKCLPPGNYEIRGQPVIVSEDRATLKEGGSLAGSILKMINAAKNMRSLEGVGLTDIIQMTAVKPAKQIGVYDRKGSLAVGKDADVLLIYDMLNIKYTICKVNIAYKGEY